MERKRDRTGNCNVIAGKGQENLDERPLITEEGRTGRHKYIYFFLNAAVTMLRNLRI